MIILVLVLFGFFLISAAGATVVALTQRDSRRRRDALQVLRIVLGAGTGLAGVSALLIKLHQAGLL
jgi:hypothetical protein